MKLRFKDVNPVQSCKTSAMQRVGTVCVSRQTAPCATPGLSLGFAPELDVSATVNQFFRWQWISLRGDGGE